MTSFRYTEVDGRPSKEKLLVHLEHLYFEVPDTDKGIVEHRKAGRTRIVIEGDDRHVEWLTEGMQGRLHLLGQGLGPDSATPA